MGHRLEGAGAPGEAGEAPARPGRFSAQAQLKQVHHHRSRIYVSIPRAWGQMLRQTLHFLRTKPRSVLWHASGRQSS